MAQKPIVTVLVVLAVLIGGAAVATTATASDTATECSFPVNQTDATGTDVVIEEPPEEIVVTAQSGAQIAWELEAQDRVIGMPVGPHSAYLDGSEDKTDVSGEDGFLDVERVVDLDPDLVIAPNVTSVEDVEQLRDAGLTVYHFAEADSIDDIRTKTKTSGTYLGQCDEADATVDWMDEQIEMVERAVAEEDRPTVLYWLHGGFTAGEGTFQHDLIETAGGANVAAEVGISGWAVISEEEIVDRNPQILVLNDYAEVPDNDAVQSTQAVQEDRIVHVDGNYFSQPAPRIVIALEELATEFHPEAFDEDGTPAEDDGTTDDPEDEESDTAADDDGEDTDDADTAEETDDDVADETDDTAGDDDGVETPDDEIPGFGIAVGVVALLSTAVALYRRD